MDTMLAQTPGTYVIPEDWRSSVPAMIELSRHLCTARATMSRDEFDSYTKEKLKLAGDTTNKVMKLCMHPIIADPQYADKLPVQWAKLYELLFLQDEDLLRIINDGSVHTLRKYEIWGLRGGKPPRALPKRKLSKPKGIYLPPDVSVFALVRAGLKHEAELGLELNQAAEKVGLGRGSYRMLRKIAILSEKAQLLSPADRSAVADVIKNIEKTRMVSPNYETIKHLTKKVWGSGKPNQQKLDKKEKERRDGFLDKLAALSLACERLVEIEIPYLSSKDVSESLNSINDGIAALAQLGKRIRGEAND